MVKEMLEEGSSPWLKVRNTAILNPKTIIDMDMIVDRSGWGWEDNENMSDLGMLIL